MTKIEKTNLATRVRRWEEITRGIANPIFGANWLRPATALLEKIFARLEHQRRLGDLVLDAGSSLPSLAADLASPHSDYSVIAVDLGFDFDVRQACKNDRREPDVLLVKGDLHDLGPTLNRPAVREFLEDRNLPPGRFDTILMNDVLNYVDFRQVIGDLVRDFLAPDGNLIICNMAGVVLEPALAHPRGVKSNSELLAFIRESGLLLEEVHQPVSGLEATNDPNHVSRLVLVARQPFLSNLHLDRSAISVLSERP